MDWTSFAKVSVAGVPLIIVVIGLVQWFKSFKDKDGNQKISGNVLQLISLAIGLLLGGGYMLTVTRPPAGDAWEVYVYWFAVLVYGLAMGLVASGLFDTAKELAEKIFASKTV